MKKKLNQEIPYVYVYIYSKLREKYPYNAYMKPKDFLTIVKRICRVPKVLHYPMLSQMEECELLKRINHQKYKLLKSDCEKMLEKLRCNNVWDAD